MAPLSILPGRVRFADERLIGNKERSRHLEAEIGVLPGVKLVRAAHRSGRILVEFNEMQLPHDELVARIREALAGEVPPMESRHPVAAVPPRPDKKQPPLFSRSILADVALHLLLPGPLDLLLPALGPSLRRGQAPSGNP
jgi:hypothetical protein